MKKVINGKLYDTFTAKFLGYFDNGKLTNYFSYLYEGLYQKRTGEHFLHCVGGALTTYNGSVIKPLTSVIKPLTYEEAQKWAEKHLDGDEYIKIFGDPEENAEKTAISISIRKDTHEKLKQAAAKAGKTVSEYIEGLI